MRSKNVLYFTQKEEDLAELLRQTGLKRNVARVLVYLANSPEASSRDIERGTDLRHPEVSIAMGVLLARGWISTREIRTENKGRPVKKYLLSRPFLEIIDSIETEKVTELDHQLSLIRSIRDLF